MATPPPSFQVEDQTDEDFFDKLVDDDDFGVEGSASKPTDMARAVSNLRMGDEAASLEDTADAGFVSEAAVQQEITDAHPPEAPRLDAQSGGENKADVGTEGSSVVMGGGTKGTSVREVQWSAFSVDSQPFGATECESSPDFLAANTDAASLSSFIENPFEEPAANVGSSYEQQSNQFYGSANQQVADTNDAQYWGNLYPGWKYDQSTGQWYQVDSYETMANAQPESYGVASADSAVNGSISECSGVSFFQQNTPSVLETINEDSATTNVSNWSQGSTEYPPNMVFDTQYPGWYYDTNTEQWHTLESYTQALQTASNTARYQLSQDANTSSSGFISDQNHGLYDELGQIEPPTKQVQAGGESGEGWYASTSSYSQQNMWRPETIDKGGQVAGFSVEQQAASFYSSAEHAGSHTDQYISCKTLEPFSNHNYGSSNGMVGYQGFVPAESMYQFNQPKVDQNLQSHLSNSYCGTRNLVSLSQQKYQGANASYSQLSYAPNVGRSSDGCPSHALVAFGFGGKLVVMKDFNQLGTKSDVGSQGAVGGSVWILSLAEVVMDKVETSSIVSGGSYDYFHALCEQSFPGPLAGGNAAAKDVNKWIDDRIMSCESPSMDFQKGEPLRLLLSLLKISCQHYGKLRSPFGASSSPEETDGPESAVTKLFASARKNVVHRRDYGSTTHCMQNLPSEGQMRATAVEVQNLLVSGRRKEALQHAQEGQLWGPALVLAAQLGEKFYGDTVRQMAHRQFKSGSPLRTLYLLIAGQPADVFSSDCFANSLSGAVSAPQPTEIRASGMLDDWEQNLAIITANRTKDDELVIIHLGDCLWKERGEITAAHTCYLVAEANFESYSDSARLCLIGADHWKYPRTYASPEAIQRTEVYEYSKVLGNSQFILLPFQPYKLIYAYMLAEVGKVSDSLRYCQASLKLLKNSGCAPEVETWKSLLSSLEDRLRTHQQVLNEFLSLTPIFDEFDPSMLLLLQGGYNTNLDPAKLVGKLFTSIDRSIHRMIGAPPPPLPPMPESSVNSRENYYMTSKVSSSQSTMAMSSLIPSASVEAISEWTGDGGRKARHNRSISEPDFGRTPKQDSDAQNKASISGGPSRFGRIGSQLLQKTVGWVSRSRSDRQAKLGETNKFYYDEKLKRWVEEGVKPPAEEVALQPPPTAAAFQNGMSDYNINSAIKGQNLSANGGQEAKTPVPSEFNSGIPPIPPSQNQFSARGRIGVRSRYVDTYNKGGAASANSFQSPSAPSVKPVAGAKFFIPTAPVTSDGQTINTAGGTQEVATDGEPCTSVVEDASPSSQLASSLPSPPSSVQSLPLQRFPSMDNISMISGGASRSDNGPLSHTRRASWSGTYMDTFNRTDETKPPRDWLGMQLSFIPSNPSPIRLSSSSSLHLSGGNVGDDLHEVEL